MFNNESKTLIKLSAIAESLEAITQVFGTSCRQWQILRTDSKKMMALANKINSCLEMYHDDPTPDRNQAVSIDGAVFDNTTEAAIAFDVSSSTVSRWLSTGRYNSFYMGSNEDQMMDLSSLFEGEGE